jgi:general stress protein YciG
MDTADKLNRTDAASGAEKPRARRGFACMAPELVRALAKKGGRAAHEQGTAHEFSPEEARAAGRKGGLAPRRPREARG